jgi:hypothetical protein
LSSCCSVLSPFWPHYLFQSYRDAAVVASSIASLHKMKMTSFPIQREVSSPQLP